MRTREVACYDVPTTIRQAAERLTAGSTWSCGHVERRGLGRQAEPVAAGTVVALLVAGAVGTFLQVVVFDLQEQESIGHAGAWGYLAGALLLALTILPALAGVILATRARRLGERSRGNMAFAINVSIAGLLVIPAIATILFG
jgi:hypothetical protein